MELAVGSIHFIWVHYNFLLRFSDTQRLFYTFQLPGNTISMVTKKCKEESLEDHIVGMAILPFRFKVDETLFEFFIIIGNIFREVLNNDINHLHTL